MYVNFGNPLQPTTIAQAIRVPGPARTTIFAVGGFTLAYAFAKGSKKKRNQTAFFGAGMGALLSIFMES